MDIRRKEFKRSVRGYLDEEVDAFLDAVANEFERLTQENAQLQDRVQVLEEQVAGHTHIREALEKTLVAAQLQSEEIRSNAQKESQSILRDAEARAKSVVSELYAQTQRVQQTLMQLKLIEEDFRFKFRALLEGYLKLLDEGPVLLSGLESRLSAHADTDLQEVSGTKAGGSATGQGTPNSGTRRDDNPTLETEEVSTLATNSEASDATGGGAAERQTQSRTTGKKSAEIVDDTTEEFTVPTSSPDVQAEENQKAESMKGQKKGSKAGAFFGGQAEGRDDPFPDDGTELGKVRDFEW